MARLAKKLPTPSEARKETPEEVTARKLREMACVDIETLPQDLQYKLYDAFAEDATPDEIAAAHHEVMTTVGREEMRTEEIGCFVLDGYRSYLLHLGNAYIYEGNRWVPAGYGPDEKITPLEEYL